MEIGAFLSQFFILIWEFFQLESPFFGLKFYEIFIGIFVVKVAIGIFKSIIDVSTPGNDNKGILERRTKK